MAWAVVDAVKACWKSGAFSDLTIRCGPFHTFKVHRNVVCPQSEFFAAAVSDGRFKEGETGIFEMPESDGPDAIKAMVDFWYTGDYTMPLITHSYSDSELVADPYESYSNSEETDDTYSGESDDTYSDESDTSPNKDNALIDEKQEYLCESDTHPVYLMRGHIKVYALADRTQQPPLKALAEEKLRKAVSEGWSYNGFAEIIHMVYAVAPPGHQGDELRGIVIKYSAENAKALFRHQRFSTIVAQVSDFGRDLSAALCGHMALRYRYEATGDLTKYKCENCNCTFFPGSLLSTACAVRYCPACGSNHLAV